MSGFARRLQQGIASQGQGGGGSTVTHGFQITAVNTGHTAYFDSALGRNVTSGDLQTVATTSVATLKSTYGSTISKKHFTGQLSVDTAGVTFVACKFDSGIDNYNGGTNYHFDLEYCTVNVIGGYTGFACGDANYTATRCNFGGGSDGFEIQGPCTVTECYVTCFGWDSGDHNDGMQAFGSSGGVLVQRCHIVAGPQNGVGGSNSSWQVADNSSGNYSFYDNYMEAASGEAPAFHMRCNDGVMDVQGNWVLNDSWTGAPAFAYYGGSGDPGVSWLSGQGWGNIRPNLVVSSNGTQVSGSGSGYTNGIIARP